ncbi:MAG TPA: hypothetical protein VF186_03175 [Gaiellaceae bacterium]
MTALALVLGVAVAVAAVLLVAVPFLREPSAADDRLDATSADEDARRRLIEDRDRALAALKELEFDHRTGKLADDDYRELVGPLRRQAARVLRALDDSRAPEAGTAGGMTEPLTPTPVPEPGPPPDEGTPPLPVPVPEPYPPPDEGTLPQE